MKQLPTFEVNINKLVHGGQGLGVLPDGRKCFVWGALPGETVTVRLTKQKKDWAEGFVQEMIKPSKNRITPEEPDTYLATSPWQIVSYNAEAKYKQAILEETFEREGIKLDWQKFYQDDQQYGYRNKMEYNFWWDNDTQKVSLALHSRGSHQKIAMAGCKLASVAIDDAGQKLIDYLNKKQVEARNLKSVIIRSSREGKIGISLFITNEMVADTLAKCVINDVKPEIIYSDPKSPASIVTKIISAAKGYTQLSDSLLGREFKYHTRSFFQANLEVYETVLAEIATCLKGATDSSILDLYSGVGSIGLSVVGGDQQLFMVETNKESTDEAKNNIRSAQNCQIINTPAEQALQFTEGKDVIIVDPPRAGLHKKVVQKITEVMPPKIVYLSCNPSTQARDIKLILGSGYSIKFAKGYNFFPRTPHIESLLVLEKLI